MYVCYVIIITKIIINIYENGNYSYKKYKCYIVVIPVTYIVCLAHMSRWVPYIQVDRADDDLITHEM